MDYNRFIKLVRERGEIDSPDMALRAIDATLTTLGERLAGNEPANLAAQLPAGIANFVTANSHGEMSSKDFGVNEFISRVASRISVSPEQATKLARAVLTTVGEATTTGEITDVVGQLPTEYLQLFYIGGGGLTGTDTWQPNSPTV